MCRVRWARPSLGRLLRPRPPSRNPAAAALRNHQPQTAHPCRARQVAAPCRSGVLLAKPFVRPCKLLRCCSYFCSSRGAKLLPAAAAAEGHDTANAFFRPPPGAPSSLRSSAACLPIGADSAHTHDRPAGHCVKLGTPQSQAFHRLRCAVLVRRRRPPRATYSAAQQMHRPCRPAQRRSALPRSHA